MTRPYLLSTLVSCPNVRKTVIVDIRLVDLAAFATALERRRSDFQTLLKGLTFPRPMGEDALPAYEEFLPEIRDRLVGVEDSHVLVSPEQAAQCKRRELILRQFWLGDLNYRIDMEDDILRAWVEEKRWKQILEKDQVSDNAYL